MVRWGVAAQDEPSPFAPSPPAPDAHLLDGDGPPAADAVRLAVQGFLLPLQVCAFPRLEKKRQVAIRRTSGAERSHILGQREKPPPSLPPPVQSLPCTPRRGFLLDPTTTHNSPGGPQGVATDSAGWDGVSVERSSGSSSSVAAVAAAAAQPRKEQTSPSNATVYLVNTQAPYKVAEVTGPRPAPYKRASTINTHFTFRT